MKNNKKIHFFTLMFSRYVILFTILVLNTSFTWSSIPHELSIRLPNLTQGPLWPPGALVMENGDFIVVGNILTEVAPGIIVPVPNQAAIVSKDTVPPLNSLGVEDFSNPLGAAYKIVRSLDLSLGSPDLDIVLFANSFGPPEGEFGGGSRVPALGDSPYNLNMIQGNPCAEIFPSQSQRFSYKRSRFPLQSVPILGFQGDQLAYDVNTGDAYDPYLKSGSHCPSRGCSGEDKLDYVSKKPVTLGKWLSADINLNIKLVDYDENLSAYTAARFKVHAKNLLPNAIYQVMAFRTNNIYPRPIFKLPDPLAIPQIMITDEEGNASFSRVVENPFPDPSTDDAGIRIHAIAVAYRSDYQTTGTCALVLGAGVDVHAVASTLSAYPNGLTDFITVPKLNGIDLDD